MKYLVFLVLVAAAFAQTTPNIGLNIPNFNTPTWNVPLNQNFTLLDSMLSGGTAIPRLKIEGTGQGAIPTQQPFEVHNTSFSAVGLFSHNVASYNSPDLVFAKSGGSETSPALIALGSYLGYVDFYGYDGTTYAKGAQINAQVGSVSWSPTVHSTNLSFQTTAAGGTGPTEVFRMGSNTDNGGDINVNSSHLDFSLPLTKCFLWASTDGFSGLPDISVCRIAASTLAIGNGTDGDKTGSLAVAVIVPGIIYSAAGTALPSCGSSIKGARAVVSDATSPTYMGTYTSGGGITVGVICSFNGSTYSWLTH